MTAGDTQRHILAVALANFRSRGFDRTSLREIGEALSISKAAVYYHFPSKDLLLEGVAGPFLDDGEALVASLQHPADPVVVLERYLDVLVRHREVVSFLANDFVALARPVIADRAQALRTNLRALLTEPGAPLPERVRVECALGALEAAASCLIEDEVAQARSTILECAISALRPVPVAAV